jgi:peptidyl-prolyl cis-trans isomerase D
MPGGITPTARARKGFGRGFPLLPGLGGDPMMPAAFSAPPRALSDPATMLIAIRSKATSWIVKILFVLLIVPFVIWGIGDMLRTRTREPNVAEVGNVEITATQLRREFDRQMRQYRQVFGENFDTEQAKKLGLVDKTLAGMVARTLFDLYVDKLGLVASDAQVRARIEADPLFKSGTGEFDLGRFAAFLRQVGLDEAGYVKTVRRDMLRQQLVEAVTAGVAAPKALVDRLYRYRNETRVADTLLVTAASMPEPAAPGDAELQAFHDQHQDMFQAPEYRSLTMVQLLPEQFAAGLSVPEDKLEQAYEQRKSEFDQPERREVEQIVFSDEAKAKEAADKLAAGEDFAKVAQETTGAPPVPLGKIEKSGFMTDLSALADAAFSTDAGKTAGPIKTPLGWHIIRVISIEPGAKSSFEQARPQLEKELVNEMAINKMIETANQLDDALAGGASLDDAAKELGLAETKIDAVDAQGQAPDGVPVAKIVANKLALNLAFTTDVGSTSSLTEDPTGGYVIVRVDGSTPAATRPLDQVKAQVAQAWIAAERDKAAAAKADALASQLASGGDMKALASDVGATVMTSQPVKRSGSDANAGITPELAAKLFQLQPGQTATAAVGPGHVVAKLVSIQPADPAADQAGVEALKKELDAAFAGDVIEEFGQALHSEIGVTVNQPAVGSLF